MWISGLGLSSLVGNSIAVENTFACVFEIHAGPWRLAAEMRLGEVPFAPDIEQVLDSVEVEKERIAAAAGEKSVGARLDDIRPGAEGDLGVGDDIRPNRFGRARLRARRREYADGLPAVLRLRKHVAECDVGQ